MKKELNFSISSEIQLKHFGTTITDMDIVKVMKELRCLLKIHDKTVKQIAQLDQYILNNNTQLMKLVQMKKTNQAIKKMHRKTIAENIRQMYKYYQEKKWEEILQMANQVMHSMEPDGTSSNQMEPYNDAHLEEDSIVERVQRINRLAMVQTCEFSRNS